MGAADGTPDGDRLNWLFGAVDAYENEHIAPMNFCNPTIVSVSEQGWAEIQRLLDEDNKATDNGA